GDNAGDDGAEGDNAGNDGAEGDNAGNDEKRKWRTDVVVRRHGGGRFPVKIKLVFENGDESIHEWDGQGRWTLITETRGSKLSYAVVDPDRVLALDIHPGNNSRFRETPTKKGAVKWAGVWMIWVQDLLSSWAFFV
ncbi:MAG: hypothetical protein GTO30_13630, partial [Acidobacteria bacterium]|nr:hypothetical protein [Acidobacteriota bacterium]NIQ86433.1 hypothetical protein [Acidobacteriota bacterium]